MEDAACSAGRGFWIFMYEVAFHRNFAILLLLLLLAMLTFVILWFYFRDASWWVLGWNTKRRQVCEYIGIKFERRKNQYLQTCSLRGAMRACLILISNDFKIGIFA